MNKTNKKYIVLDNKILIKILIYKMIFINKVLLIEEC